MDHVIGVDSNGWEDEGKRNCDVGQAWRPRSRRLGCKRGGAVKLEDRNLVIMVDVRSYSKVGYSLTLNII